VVVENPVFGEPTPPPRPSGANAIAGVFILAAIYLLFLGAIMRLRPGAVSMNLGSPLLGGLELAGPFMFWLAAAVGLSVGAGLWGLHNWARWAAIGIALAGMVALLPDISSAVVDFRVAKLAWGGLGIMVRVVILQYLFQAPVAEAFTDRGIREPR
jgi:hypothetical protein